MSYSMPIDGPRRRTRVPYTPEELERAERLFRVHRSWEPVAEILDRNPAALATAMCRFRAGDLTFKEVARVAEADKVVADIVEDMITQGISMSEAARRRGKWPSSVLGSLRRRGWDQETIDEERQLRIAA